MKEIEYKYGKKTRKDLLGFAREFSKVFCYGAGAYGKAVAVFLKERGVNLSSFIVSKKADEVQEVEGASVYALDEAVEKLQDPTAGIILSLAETYQSEVKEALLAKGISLAGRLYEVDVVQMFLIQDTLFARSSGKILLKAFWRKNAIEPLQCSVYETRFLALRQNFHRFDLRFIKMENMGALGYWIYHCDWKDRYGEEGVFYLFFPFPYARDLWDPDAHGKWDWLYEPPNKFLAGKLREPGMEVIQPETLGFWQYCMKEHREMFRVLDGDSIALMSEAYNAACESGEIQFRAQYINLTQGDIGQGEAFLQRIGAPQRWVCAAARDSSYRRDIRGYDESCLDDIDKYRNSDIQRFEKMAQTLAAQGICSLRMGAKVDREMPASSALIDYANLYRTEFLDVFLCSRCLFFIGDSSGIMFLATLFGRPIVQVNTAVLTIGVDANMIVDEERDLMIPQKYWDLKRERYLTFREMMEYEVYGGEKSYGVCSTTNTYLLYQHQGIIPIKNTEEEICAAAEEMVQRLAGTVQYTAEDLALQERFHNLRKEYMGKGNYLLNFRIGRDFLRENKWLLD